MKESGRVAMSNPWMVIFSLLVASCIAAARPAAIPQVASLVSREVKVFNFQPTRGNVRITFQGNAALAEARAEVTAKPSKWGYDLDTRVANLPPASSFGSGYLTYVLWAITPDGRLGNIAEIKVSGGKGKTDVVADFPAFGLFVTAEPYFAVPRPSSHVVLESNAAQSSSGSLAPTMAKYEVVDKTSSLAGGTAVNLDPGAPLELLEARNAVRIAQSAGADRLAQATFNEAREHLTQAESLYARGAEKKRMADAARQAVITAEDARAIAVQRSRSPH